MSNNYNDDQNQQQGTGLSASIKNKQRTFNKEAPRAAAEHPLFKNASTAKIFPALANVPEKEVASMFGLPDIDKKKIKEQYLIEHSDPFREKPSIFSRNGMRGADNGNNNNRSPGKSGSNSLAVTMSNDYYGNNNSKSAAGAGGGQTEHDQLLRNRAIRPFVVTRHGVTTGQRVESVFAGCDFAGDDRNEKAKTREHLHRSIREKNRGHAFVVRNPASAVKELDRQEFLNAVDDDTMDLLKDYIFSGKAALDAAARKRDDINEFRTNQRRQKGIRQQREQQKLKMIRDS